MSLWTEASRDVEGENALRRFTAAKLSVAGLWPFLAAAGRDDFENRLALVADRLETAIPEDDVREEVIASLREDFTALDESRTRERISAETARRKAARKTAELPPEFKEQKEKVEDEDKESPPGFPDETDKDDDDEKKESAKTAAQKVPCGACKGREPAKSTCGTCQGAGFFLVNKTKPLLANLTKEAMTTCLTCGEPASYFGMSGNHPGVSWAHFRLEPARVGMQMIPIESNHEVVPSNRDLFGTPQAPAPHAPAWASKAEEEPPPFSGEGQEGGEKTSGFIAKVKAAARKLFLEEDVPKAMDAARKTAKFSDGDRVVLEQEDHDPDMDVTIPAGTTLTVEGVEDDLIYATYGGEDVAVDASKCRLASLSKEAEFPWQKPDAEATSEDKAKEGEEKPPAEGEAPAAGGDDIGALTPGAPATLHYKLADGTEGDAQVTLDANDGTTATFSYDKGTFVLTKDGNVWKDPLGTEFSIGAGAPAAPAAPGAPAPAAEKPAEDKPKGEVPEQFKKKESKTAGWVDDLDKSIFDGGIDNVTKGMLTAVMEALSPANREKFAALPLETAVTVGWKLVSPKGAKVANEYLPSGNPYAVDQNAGPTPPAPGGVGGAPGTGGAPQTTKPRQMPAGTPQVPQDPMAGVPGAPAVVPGATPQPEPTQPPRATAVLDTELPIQCEACGRKITAKLSTIAAGLVCACGCDEYDIDDSIEATSERIRGKNRYEVVGTSVSGRPYRDFVFGNSEQEAREGAIRERGFRSVTTVRLLDENYPEHLGAIDKEADFEGLNLGGAGLGATIRALINSLLRGDNKIPSWFPKSYLTPEEIATGRWSTTFGGGGDPQFAFGSLDERFAEWSQNNTAPARDVTEVREDFRCSRCFHEFVDIAKDPAQPFPACPNCGSEATTAAGANVAVTRPKHSKVEQITAGILATNPGMAREAAVKLAEETVRRYPKVAARPEPGSVARCDHCGQLKPLSPNRGEDLCFECLSAAVDDERAGGFRVIEDGRETIYDPNKVTPRAWEYRR